jgi:hypothetical protein
MKSRRVATFRARLDRNGAVRAPATRVAMLFCNATIRRCCFLTVSLYRAVLFLSHNPQPSVIGVELPIECAQCASEVVMKKILVALVTAIVICATPVLMSDTASAQWGYRGHRGWGGGFGFRGGWGYRGFGYRGLGWGLGYRGLGYGGYGYGGYGYGGYGYGGYGYGGYGGYGYGGYGYAGYGSGGYGYGGCGNCGYGGYGGYAAPVMVVAPPVYYQPVMNYGGYGGCGC